MRLSLVVGVVASFKLAQAGCQDGQCADVVEDDAAALMQVRTADAFGPLPEKTLVFGTPLAGFHNATLWVYHQALMQLGGYKIKMITKFVHQILWPMFTGVGGTDTDAETSKPYCKEEGCADKCREEGLGNKSPCVDFAVDSNLPKNHATWLAQPDQIATYTIMGTAMENIAISLYTPKYTGWKTLEDPVMALGKLPVNQTILGFQGDPETCGVNYCPACLGGDLKFITEAPLGTNGFKYEALPCPDFEKEMRRKLDAKENFMALMFTPQAFLVEFPEMVAMSVEPYTYTVKPNQGKAQYANPSYHKFSQKALAVLGAIYIGTEDVQKMDAWSQGLCPEPPCEKLCDYSDWNHACSLEAANKWIKLNSNGGKGPMWKGVYETFFW